VRSPNPCFGSYPFVEKLPDLLNPGALTSEFLKGADITKGVSAPTASHVRQRPATVSVEAVAPQPFSRFNIFVGFKRFKFQSFLLATRGLSGFTRETALGKWSWI
jgi:hypothetical protein